MTAAAGLLAVAAVAGSSGPVGLDTETTGLNHARHQVRLLQLATARGTFLIDVFAVGPAALVRVFEALAAAGVVGHNLGFDLPFLMRLGFTPGRVVDTMLASQVLHAGDLAAKHGLRDVAARHLGLTLDKELQQADWAGPLTPDMLRYAALDAEVPLRAWAELAAELEAAGFTAVAEIEFAALPCVAGRPSAASASTDWRGGRWPPTRTPSGHGCGRRSTPPRPTPPRCSAPATGTARTT